ncbi:hypothetical protein [Salipiger abyssi]|uniref:hypothetical protein n=1 Tax=Salipiger abyssi TaxID=1250539 RepID=UPI001A8D579D|nr:hypothetical protein [Salipiger abyssi]MBN9889833.1 hypothetical protein [Salipiger abyssi]
MTPLENLLNERFSTAFDEFQFKSISDNISDLMDNALRDGDKDKVYQSIISSLISSVLLLQSKLDGVSEAALQNYAEKNGLRMPAIEVLPPPAEAKLDITDPFTPAGLGKLETSAASHKKFRWLLGDIPFVATFRVKNEGTLKIRIDYLSFADGLSEKDIALTCNDSPVPLKNDSKGKFLEGEISFKEDYHPSLSSIKLCANRSVPSGSRNLALSVTDITVRSA